MLDAPPRLLKNRLDWLSQTAVWVIGFGETRNFTPQEFAVLAALQQRVSEISITVMADALPGDRLAAEQTADVYRIGRRSAESLIRRLTPQSMHRVPAVLNQPAIRLVQSARPEDQIAWLSGEIRQLVLSGHYRFRDINIAVCRPAEDLPRLQVAFKQYNIPIFLDQVRNLSGTALMRTVLGLLDVARDGWTRQPVMRLLRAGLLTDDLAVVDVLENEFLARGLFRFDQLLKEYPQLFASLESVVNKLKKAPIGTAKIAALREGLERIGLQNRCEVRIADLSEQGETESALALAKSWNALAETLDQLEQLAGDIPMSLDAFRGLIAVGLDNADSGVLPTALDNVAVGNLARSRQRDCKVLFLLGADRANLPPAAAPEGLLKGFDREVLSVHLEQTLPNQSRDQVFADAALIHSLLIQPTEQLIVLAPVEDVSPVVLRLAEQSGVENILLTPLAAAADVRLNAPQPALNRLLQFSREPLADPAVEDAFSALAAALIQKGYPVREAQRLLLREDPLSVQIDPELVEARFGKDLYLSVSQLEKYAECPFRHFAAYGLKLQDRKIFEPEAADSGSLLHAIAEQSLGQLLTVLAAGQDPDAAARLIQTWLSGELDQILGQVLNALQDQDDLKRFFSPGLHASVGRRLERVARTSLVALLRQLLAENFQPAAFEWTFARENGNALQLPLDSGHSVVLNGKIDRVDLTTSPEDPSFRIIDYKSGNQQVDYERIYHGLALQLPAYLTAYAENHPGLRAADACYFHFDEPVFNQQSDLPLGPEDLEVKLQKHFKLRSLGFDEGQLQLVQNHVTAEIRQWSQAILKGEFSAHPRQISGGKKACEYCQYQAICGTDLQPQNSIPLEKLGGMNSDGKKIKKKDDLIGRLQGQAAHAAD